MTITPDMLSAARANLAPSPSPPADFPTAKADGAKLGPAGPEGISEYVVFDYNPASIAIAHGAPVVASAGLRPPAESAAAPTRDASPDRGPELSAQNVDELEKAKGTTTIILRALIFDGKYVARDCLRLLSWTHFEPAGAGSAKRNELPLLKFIWGEQIYLVHLNHVSATYTRFSSIGKPVRASVDLTLHSVPKIPGPTNPSSGGLPGRRTHLLTGAERLPELSTRFYGRPGRWREIAAANRFDDPLRVRPGTLVYVPGEREGGGR